jgi:hypothetical protein
VARNVTAQRWIPALGQKMTFFTTTRIPILRYIVTEGGDSVIQQTHLVVKNVDVTLTRWVWTPIVT